MLNLLAAGEFALTPGVYEYSVRVLKNNGAPVDGSRREPVIVYTGAVSPA
jgi:hypothetical protein